MDVRVDKPGALRFARTVDVEITRMRGEAVVHLFYLHGFASGPGADYD